MLSDTNIKHELNRRQTAPDDGISIEPFEEKCLTPIGYDLRVGKKGFSWKSKREINIEREGAVQIEPYDTLIVETLESISLSKGFSGTIHSSVSKVIPKGLSQISTTIDPGWTGKLLISVHNFYDVPTELRFGERLCTVCFYKVDEEATKGVGNPPDREDIWDQLLDKSSEKRREEQRKQQENNRRLIVLIIIGILILILGAYISYKDPEKGAAFATFLAVGLPILLECIKPKNN